MPEANRPLRIFLCHSSGDKPTVRELYQHLDAEGWIDAWLDVEKLFPGQDWNLEIEKAVEAADIILVCLTNSSVTKEGYVQRELRMVLDLADYKPEGALFIIPVRLEECEPPRRLRKWQFADYFPPEERDRAYKRLLVSLRNRAKALGILVEPSQPAPQVAGTTGQKIPTSKEQFENKFDQQIFEILQNTKLDESDRIVRLVNLFYEDLAPKLEQLKRQHEQEKRSSPEGYKLIGQHANALTEFQRQEFENFKVRVLRIGNFSDQRERLTLDRKLTGEMMHQGIQRMRNKR